MAFKRYIRPCLERKNAYGQRIVSPAEVEMIKKIYRRAYTLMRAPKRPISQPNLTKKKANDAHIRAIMAHFLRKVGNPNREIAPGRAAIFAIPPEYADLPDKKKIKIFEGILRQLGASFENEEPRKNTLARVKDIFSKFAPYLPDDYKQRIQEFIDSYPLNNYTTSTS